MDIFSIGCVIYFVLTPDQHPFGSNPIGRQANIQNEKSDPSKLSEIRKYLLVHEYEECLMTSFFSLVLNAENYTALDLVQKMISNNSSVRYCVVL